MTPKIESQQPFPLTLLFSVLVVLLSQRRFRKLLYDFQRDVIPATYCLSLKVFSRVCSPFITSRWCTICTDLLLRNNSINHLHHGICIAVECVKQTWSVSRILLQCIYHISDHMGDLLKTIHVTDILLCIKQVHTEFSITCKFLKPLFFFANQVISSLENDCVNMVKPLGVTDWNKLTEMGHWVAIRNTITRHQCCAWSYLTQCMGSWSKPCKIKANLRLGVKSGMKM